jgi:hypothetical protein
MLAPAHQFTAQQSLNALPAFVGNARRALLQLDDSVLHAVGQQGGSGSSLGGSRSSSSSAAALSATHHVQLAHSTTIAGMLLLAVCCLFYAADLFLGGCWPLLTAFAVKAQLASIAMRATGAHDLVTRLTRDLHELDVTKRNLALTIEVTCALVNRTAAI